MSTVLLAGTGTVGIRAARQIIDTPGLDRLLLAGRNTSRAEEIADALGAQASRVELGADDALPEGIDAVASALPPDQAVTLARRALDAGVPFVSSLDDAPAITTLIALDSEACRHDVLVAPGCGVTPGLTDVLARHAADALDSVDEIHVARSGVAGAACVAAARRAQRVPVAEWHDGQWREDKRASGELVWFPDPVGPRECAPVADGIALLVRSFPSVRRATVRLDEPPARRLMWGRRRGIDDSWGAARVEVWGWRGSVRESMVYGMIDRTAVAAGTVLAVAAARLAGLARGLDARDGPAAGVHGLASLVEPVPFLAELARRGVKAAVFEGLRVA